MSIEKLVFEDFLKSLEIVLEEAEQGKYIHKSSGCCEQLYDKQDHSLVGPGRARFNHFFLFRQYTKCWDKYSGDQMYPIPNVVDILNPFTWFRSPKGSYIHCTLSRSQWEGRNLELRLELLGFIIKYVKHDLETGEWQLMLPVPGKHNA